MIGQQTASVDLCGLCIADALLQLMYGYNDNNRNVSTNRPVRRQKQVGSILFANLLVKAM
jgi:hypothetical protein